MSSTEQRTILAKRWRASRYQGLFYVVLIGVIFGSLMMVAGIITIFTGLTLLGQGKRT